MAHKIRHLKIRSNAAGEKRFYWQPAPGLRAHGWENETLPADEAAALARAEELNRKVDAWRRGQGPAGNIAVPASDRVVQLRDNGGPPLEQPIAPAPARPIRAERGTVGWLIDDWKKTPKWTAKPGSSIKPYSPSTRRFYEWACDIIWQWADDGELPARKITPARVQQLYETFLHVSHSKANAVVTVLRILLEHARKRDIVASNAATKPGLISLPPRLRIWSHEEEACMVAHADALGLPSIGDAILLGADLGQREGDILRLQRIRYSNGVFYRIQQRKTNAIVQIPATPRLRDRLELAIARIDAVAQAERQAALALGRPARPTPPYLVVAEGTGTRYTEDTFRRLFARVRAAAAGKSIKISRKPGVETMNDEDLLRTSHLPKCRTLLGREATADDPEILQANFQDLRDTAVTNLAEAGCTIPQICAITGHTEKSAYNVLKHYLALNGAMAAEAIAKLVEHYERQEAARKAAAKEQQA